MIAKLMIVMTVIPAIELALLLQLGQWMGAGETFLIIVLTGLLGATLAKREGLDVLRQLKADASKGIPPADRLVEGLMVLVGGVLLITPGVLTDLAGVLLMLGPSRRWMAPRIKRLIADRIGLPAGLNAGAPAWGPGSGASNVERGPAPQARAEAKQPDLHQPGPFNHPVR